MGSNPIGHAVRLKIRFEFADVAQLVEHAIGNGEVSGSIPDVGSKSQDLATLAQLVERPLRKR